MAQITKGSLFLIVFFIAHTVTGQHIKRDIPVNADSVIVKAHPSYDRKGGFHRLLFGENYRKEWAVDTKLPVLRISSLQGGLKPSELGGGMQSKSLRLVDANGKEWVIRSIEKNPDALLPAGLKTSFARDWIDDAMSAQHPYSALIVPPLAEAVGVPHATPVIGVIAPDEALDSFEHIFSGMLVLFEEREPLGETDNTLKMFRKLKEDNDNKLDAATFLRARILDAFVGDWDRHEDQWRWYPGDGKEKYYQSVPRDRDQVFHVTEGLFPKMASRDYILPTLRDFDMKLTKIKWLLFKTRFGNAYPELQFSKIEWMKEVTDVQAALTDEVLERSLKQLPKSSYDLRHDELLAKLKSRRGRLSERMEWYYDFIQKRVDIQTSDKKERVEINDAANGDVAISIHKINKDGEVKDELMHKVYDRSLTKEIRIYTGSGEDSVFVNTSHSKIKLRLIGGDDKKYYHVADASKRVKIYNKDNRTIYSGKTSRMKRFTSEDSLHTAYTPVNLYNVWQPLVTAGLNLDDGIIVGAGLKYTKQEGFRKYPYASTHQFLFSHSFALNAFRLKYGSEWIHAIGRTDIVIDALLRAPANKQNFFGLGNETKYEEDGRTISYYRARINTYQLDPALRWKFSNREWLSAGPSVYYYTFSEGENVGRITANSSEMGSYDSSIIDKAKLHVGVFARYFNDHRDSKIIPTQGHFINIKLQAYKATESYLRSFAQLIPELAIYRSLNKNHTIVVADRLGGTVSIGKPAFYQSAFIGGHENLLGFRQFRFAGLHSVYNNLELRVKIADVASYILPGQLGITGFWDIGRVWVENDASKKWHNSVGGGIYFAPASLLSANLLAGFSEEGVYPYFTLGFRF